MIRLERACMLAILFVLALMPRHAHAQQSHGLGGTSVTWTAQTLHLDWRTASRVVRSQTHTYAIRHPKGRIVGRWVSTRQLSPHVRLRVMYPRYAVPAPPAPPANNGCTRATTARITAYTPVDTPGHFMADGTPVYYGGAAASPWIPFGTRVYVPSFHTTFTVHDRGAPWAFDAELHFDLWLPANLYSVALATNRYEQVFICE